jgi:hypothetical protein
MRLDRLAILRNHFAEELLHRRARFHLGQRLRQAEELGVEVALRRQPCLAQRATPQPPAQDASVLPV